MLTSLGVKQAQGPHCFFNHAFVNFLIDKESHLKSLFKLRRDRSGCVSFLSEFDRVTSNWDLPEVDDDGCNTSGDKVVEKLRKQY